MSLLLVEKHPRVKSQTEERCNALPKGQLLHLNRNPQLHGVCGVTFVPVRLFTHLARGVDFYNVSKLGIVPWNEELCPMGVDWMGLVETIAVNESRN